ncbi:MAG: type IV pilus twitching motility protein PilT [Akkermansiaceae bacterium]
MDLVDLMSYAAEARASDIHLAPGRYPMLRIDGELQPVVEGFPVLSKNDCENIISEMLRPDQSEILAKELEIDISYAAETAQGRIRLRVNIHQQQQGLAAVCRIVPDKIPGPETLTLEESIYRFAKLPRGLILFTGATGTGKSTTLACLIDIINQQRRSHILTVEDPIEYTYTEKSACITQRELGLHTKGFAPALKSALREDPDVILVGEMRDLETISLALTASETGHLVFSTVHTSDTSQTIDRIIDVFPPMQQALVRSQLAAVLQGVVTQVLLPRSAGKGRVAAREILIPNAAVRTLIREGNTHQLYSALTSGLQEGMCPLELSLADKVHRGVLDKEVAESAANRPDIYKDYLMNQNYPEYVPGLAVAEVEKYEGDSKQELVAGWE